MKEEKKKRGQPKNKGGRPTKLTKNFIQAIEEVINESGEDMFIYTNEELVMLANEKLEEKERITDRTFENWVRGDVDPKDTDIYTEFFRLIKKALLEQRKNLFNKYREEEGQWQKWAWIIERKFSEWNMKQIVESKVDQTSNIKVEGVDLSKLSYEELKELSKED